MQLHGLEVSIAARLCAAGMPKPLIVGAFRQSRQNDTTFIEELYAMDGADDALIARCIADEAGLAFEDAPRDAHIIAPSGPDFVKLRRLRHVVALTADHMVQIYIVPTLADIAHIKRCSATSRTGAMRVRIVSPSRLAEILLCNHRSYLAEHAVRMIEAGGDGRSARTVINGRQGTVIGALLASSLFLAMLVPGLLWLMLHVLFSIFFVGCILLRIFASHHSRRARIRARERGAGCSNRPVYSVMIALYMEADIVPQLVEAMSRLNWPRSRLEVLFLCEEDDPLTLAAFERQTLPACFRVIPVPGFGPRTKPKALNYGLQLTAGDFVVVYDAEDRPHPDQLQEAWQKFALGPQELGCLQAPLVIGNASEGWIERQFAFEYAAQFRGLLPWLADGRFVVPLGGSSNHFRRDCLMDVGGWDPFNVTEDAELGSRLARCGYGVDMLSAPTIEDAPMGLGVWLRQRTRWLKGWMQTWLVETRQSSHLLRRAGLKRFLVYHLLTAGLLVSALLYPFMLVLIAEATVIVIFADAAQFNATFPVFDVMNVILGFLSFHLLGRTALKNEKMPGPVLLWMPVYWAMISAAAWRALWQLHAAPFLWEKTPHQLTRLPFNLR